MADKAVSELVAASSVTPSDLFVLEQSGTAKKLTGQTLENWLLSFADGHGGIQTITKVDTVGLVDTYRITLADTTTIDFTVTNGKSISSINKTSSAGLVDTYRINYNDDTYTTFTITNGAKGDKGDNTYVWIKYASQQPTADSHSFGDLPDAWIGIYYGELSAAPSDWQLYAWYKILGATGDVGAPATLVSALVQYQVSSSGTVPPSGTWLDAVPSVPQGSYLWTKIQQTFNTGEPVVAYAVARMGIDGTGTVRSVCGAAPDIDGNVQLYISSIPSLQEVLDSKLSSIADGSITAGMLAESAITAGRLLFSNVSVAVNTFADDITYANFPFRASIALQGALGSMLPEVVFSLADAASGNFAPVVESYDGGVYIYAVEKPEEDVTIPVITLWR